MGEKKIFLTNKEHIITGAGADMRFNKSKHEYPLHDHEFHEFVLVTDGCANHYINGKIMPMSTGCLYFIRNTDTHTYSDFVGELFEYYTLLFETEVIEEMRKFLGENLIDERYFSSPLPPEVHLDKAETERLAGKLSSVFLCMHDDTEKFRTESRLLVIELFSRYFSKKAGSDSEIPLWLEYAYEKMQNPMNFTKGSERFFEICGRRREHCTRMLKKHYGVTPNEYISDLRMKYAASLLSSGDLTVSEIACECGYNSIPHFYGIFQAKFGISPGEYKSEKSRQI